MTCAACVNRVEKRLAKLDGVTATVNPTTGQARVSHPLDITAEILIATVKRAGYTAELPLPPEPQEDARPSDPEEDEARKERERLLITALLSVPVLVLSMVPARQFHNWQWLCFVLAAPVVVWSAWPFHLRAARGLRYSTATMDTLVSLGVIASFSWSAYALFLGGAGEPGGHMPFPLLPSAGGDVAHVYLEAAVGVPLFVLTGRFLEARARSGTGQALRSLAGLAAKDVTVRENGQEQRIPIDQLRIGQEFVVRPGDRVATDGVERTPNSPAWSPRPRRERLPPSAWPTRWQGSSSPSCALWLGVGLQRLRPADQDAELAATARGGQQSRGGRQSQGAGTGDDQDRHARGDGSLRVCLHRSPAPATSLAAYTQSLTRHCTRPTRG